VLDDAGLAEAEISVTLLDDAAIQAMNLQYLQRDYITDVIAFSLGDDPVIGDVYVGAGQAERQAAELGISTVEEFVRLAIHGTLHVLGHDHPDGPERVDSDMFVLQERLVRDVLDAGGS
jgi:probable rRNA maturation factor